MSNRTKAVLMLAILVMVLFPLLACGGTDKESNAVRAEPTAKPIKVNAPSPKHNILTDTLLQVTAVP